jgi:DNA-binding SARP family transcriptional activator/tetratricopeptide (TPR) repeat protein
MEEPGTTIRLCGRFVVEIDGEEIVDRLPSGQARSVLTYLIANRDHAVDRAELVDVIWPHSPPKDPQGDLRPILSRLRRALAPAALEGRDRLHLVLPEPVSIDTEEASGSIAEARAAAESGEWDRVRAKASRARELLAGGFLPGQEADWIETRRRELDELELEALELTARCGIALGGGGLRDAERAARKLIERSPYREAGYRLLMESLAADGNPAEALRVYEQLRQVLRDELGTNPAPEVQAIHRQLLAGEDAGAEGTAAPTADAQPKPTPLPPLLSPRERGVFIGREEELRTLRESWQRARGGDRELALLAGDPGIGKTRLASEFAVQAHVDGTVLYATCPQEPMLPYQPIVEALRHYALTHSLDHELGRLGPGAPELALLIPEIRGALPKQANAPPEDPETRRYMMFDAVAALIETASARAPILLILDDLHWADPPTLQLLRHLLESQRPASLLIVGTYREAEVLTGEPLAELVADLRRTRRLERIRLRGLDEDEVADLVAFYSGSDAPETLRRTVHEGTDGNPFFVEEVMRHLVESGTLFERDGRWTSALTVEEIGVPEEVEEVLLSRLARLSDGSLATLRRGAVLGREFSFAVLQAMSEVDDDELIAALEEALEAQLIVEEAAQASGPRYGFTHSLVRETLIKGIGTVRAQRMHAEAARAIEAVGGAESDLQVAALALHYRLAGQAGDPAKGVEFCLRAGNRARELLAWDDAALHLDGAVTLLEAADEQPEQRARLLVGLAELMVMIGDVGRQLAYLERALALFERLGDEQGAARVHSRLGMAYALMDSIYAEFFDLGKAFDHLEAAGEVLERKRVQAARGHLLTAIATANTYALHIDRGIAAAEEAMAIADELDNELLWIGAAEANCWHQFAAGNLEYAFDTLERCFDAADQRRRPFLAWTAMNMAGQHGWGVGDPDRAQAFFERGGGLPYIERTAYRHLVADGIGRCHLSRGELAEARRMLADAKPVWFTHALKPLLDLWEGRWTEVEGLAAEVLETSRRTGNRWDEWSAQHFQGRVLALRGQHEVATALFESALAIVVEGCAPQFELWVRPDLARSLAQAGRLDEAGSQIERCREIVSNGEEWTGLAARVELSGAVVMAHGGRLERADASFTRALEAFDRYKLRCDQADAMHQWGLALAGGGDRPGAAEKLEAALDLYRRHEAGEPLRERVEGDLSLLSAAAK